MKKVIIAGNYEQYVRCLHQNCLNDSVPFITKPSQIEELRESVEPIFFGTFWENPAYEEIKRAMHSKGIRVKGQYIKKKMEGIKL